MTNDFLPFCPTDTGTNLLNESDYTAAADRVSGNKPGVASSKLNNKALRQSSYITSQVAQLLSNLTSTDVLDDANPTKLLAQLTAAFTFLPPVLTKYISGSGNHNVTFQFFILSGNATVGATYTNNGVTYTVKSTIAAGLLLLATGNGAPTASGTLTKASGTGDATITFYAVRAPLVLKVSLVGGGGGGGGAGTGSGGSGGSGAASTFGTSLLNAGGGGGGQALVGIGGAGGTGGTSSLGTGPTGIAMPGNGGSGASGIYESVAGAGSALGGGGAGSVATGNNGGTNTGGGGSGGAGSGVAGNYGGAGGGSGGYVKGYLSPPLASYSFTVGTGGSQGAAGSGSTFAGGAGASGVILVEERYN